MAHLILLYLNHWYLLNFVKPDNSLYGSIVGNTTGLNLICTSGLNFNNNGSIGYITMTLGTGSTSSTLNFVKSYNSLYGSIRGDGTNINITGRVFISNNQLGTSSGVTQWSGSAIVIQDSTSDGGIYLESTATAITMMAYYTTIYSSTGVNTCVQLAPSGTSWSSLSSDIRIKTNIIKYTTNILIQ
jgi:hypothetical protein